MKLLNLLRGYFKKEITLSTLLPFVMLLVGLWLFPLDIVQRDLSVMPGDKGDSRFNNYILEHGYNFLSGKVKNYWDAPFMYPAKNAIAYSDNLLGTVPLYALFRVMHCDRETSFQLWFIALFVLNFVCCYWALKKWSDSTVLSSVGAYIFAFSIFILTHINHAQVFPRFMIPLILYWFWNWLKNKKLTSFYYLATAIVFQFYCGIYLGFFIIYILLFTTVGYFIIYRDKTFFTWLIQFKNGGKHLLTVFLAVLILLPMFIPYIEISNRFGYRDFDEVRSYIPTFRAYYSAIPESAIWRSLSWHIRDQGGNWWELFLFPGLIAYLGILLFPFVYKKATNKKELLFLLLSLFLLMVFTMNFNGFTFYKMFFNLPGFGSMRSINRIINAEIILFVLLLVAVLKVVENSRWKNLLLLLPILVVIDNTTSYWERQYKKEEVQHREKDTKERIQKYVTGNKAIAYQHYNFMGQEPFDHLDVMIACQDLNVPCVNAYTGLYPQHYKGFFNGEGLDSLTVWLSANNKSLGDVVVVSEEHASFLHRNYVKIKCANGKYLKIDKEHGDKLMAIGNTSSDGELFEYSLLDDSTTVLRASTGKFACAEFYDNGLLVANRDGAGDWERFMLTKKSDGNILIKTFTNHYLSLEAAGTLRSVDELPTNQSVFTFETPLYY
ncbi:MAG: hypothetical protein ACKOX3_03775 [Bacteroidota bacterium]